MGRFFRMVLRALKAVKWWAIYKVTRPHMLDLRSPENGYDGGYQDAVEDILFACFNRFCRFMDREDPLRFYSYNEVNEQGVSIASEMVTLYHWWRVDRPDRSNIGHPSYDEEDQKMLERLIAIRENLWT